MPKKKSKKGSAEIDERVPRVDDRSHTRSPVPKNRVTHPEVKHIAIDYDGGTRPLDLESGRSTYANDSGEDVKGGDGSVPTLKKAGDIFILFNEHEDGVIEIERSLRRYGLSTYLWRRDIDVGEEWTQFESNKLKSARCVLLFLGKRGWGPNHSRLTEEALKLEKTILPVLVGKPPSRAMSKFNGLFARLRYEDLQDPNAKSIKKLADRIRNRSRTSDVNSSQGFGTASHIVREAKPEESLLDAPQYANVIAGLIRSIGNDEPLSLAILAPWGRGKTHLMRLVAQRLESAPEQSSDYTYNVIPFSAWKYRSTPEIWAHLYETLYGEARRAGWHIPIRTGLLRHGLWPATMALWALALSLTTIMQKAHTFQVALSALGLAGLAYLLGAFFHLRRAGTGLKSTYWELPRHHQKLGLQAAIGDDLEALLCGWMPDKLAWQRAFSAIFLKNGIATAAYSMALLAVWLIIIDAATYQASNSVPAGLMTIGVGAIVLTAGLVLPSLFVWRQDQSRGRIVLVVDDLDRCEPEQMLEIIECLQLFLDEKRVKQRLKLVMLVEEDILKNALLRKYLRSTSAPPDGDGRRFTWENQLINDNLEKMFLVWLRLQPLGREELQSLFDKLCGLLGPQESEGSATGAKIDEPEKTGRDAPAEKVAKDGLDEVKQSHKTAKIANTTLTSDEKNAILSYVEDLIVDGSRHSWGPRAVRSFVFRYQLARMLLDAIGRTSVDPNELVRAISMASNHSLIEPEPSIDETVWRIAQQVC